MRGDLRGRPVGRRAPLTAALVTGFGASLLLGLLVTLALLGQGTAGALAFGLAFAGTGCAFAAVAAGIFEASKKLPACINRKLMV